MLFVIEPDSVIRVTGIIEIFTHAILYPVHIVSNVDGPIGKYILTMTMFLSVLKGTFIDTSIGVNGCSQTVLVAVRILSDIRSAVRPLIEAMTVRLLLAPLAFISLTIFPLKNAVAMFFAFDHVANVCPTFISENILGDDKLCDYRVIAVSLFILILIHCLHFFKFYK